MTRAERSDRRHKAVVGMDRDAKIRAVQRSPECGICGDRGCKLVVDHDHVTGKFRGILCATCNTALGGLGDDEPSVRRALLYLLGAGQREEERSRREEAATRRPKTTAAEKPPLNPRRPSGQMKRYPWTAGEASLWESRRYIR